VVGSWRTTHRFGSPQKRTPWLDREVLSCRWRLRRHLLQGIGCTAGSAKALLNKGYGGATGFEPVTSSVSANGGEALCGSPFPQLAADRRRRGYAFSFGVVGGRLGGSTPPSVGSALAVSRLGESATYAAVQQQPQPVLTKLRTQLWQPLGRSSSLGGMSGVHVRAQRLDDPQALCIGRGSVELRLPRALASEMVGGRGPERGWVGTLHDPRQGRVRPYLSGGRRSWPGATRLGWPRPGAGFQ
jgi:hypothetical protein